MGMDLCAIDPKDDEHDYDLHYNWTGWGWLISRLNEWGVDTSEFSGANDGDIISASTCECVADAISNNLSTLDFEDQLWIRHHIDAWRGCGGFRQH